MLALALAAPGLGLGMAAAAGAGPGVRPDWLAPLRRPVRVPWDVGFLDPRARPGIPGCVLVRFGVASQGRTYADGPVTGEDGYLVGAGDPWLLCSGPLHLEAPPGRGWAPAPDEDLLKAST